MNKHFIFGAAMGAILIASQPATSGGRPCGERDKIVNDLATNHGETRQSIGLGLNNMVIETFASSETGSWTILATTPAGHSCLLANGIAYDAANDPFVPTKNDA
jgi:hypothetical protein